MTIVEIATQLTANGLLDTIRDVFGAVIVAQLREALNERCDLEAMKAIARPFLPPRPPDAPAEPDLSQPGALEALATQAGITPESSFDTTWAYEYPDEDTLGRALLAPAGLATLAGPGREQEVKAAIIEGLSPFRTNTGRYRLENEFHFLIARA